MVGPAAIVMPTHTRMRNATGPASVIDRRGVWRPATLQKRRIPTRTSAINPASPPVSSTMTNSHSRPGAPVLRQCVDRGGGQRELGNESGERGHARDQQGAEHECQAEESHRRGQRYAHFIVGRVRIRRFADRKRGVGRRRRCGAVAQAPAARRADARPCR